MRIGLLDIDSKIPNLALMKLSAYHKRHGDHVSFWNAFEPFDRIYASKIFSYTSFSYLPKETIKGGTGYSLTEALSPEIEHTSPDYDLYHIDYAMGYHTRGCINSCGFCVVPKKEGPLRIHAPLDEFWHGQKRVVLLDNAITDLRQAWKTLEFIRDQKIELDLMQGFNVCTIQPACAKILAEIKLWKNKQWKIAWDNYNELDKIQRGLGILEAAGIKGYRIMCYVLTNYNTSINQDLERVNYLELNDIDPFIMVYNQTEAPQIYRDLQRWCNRPQIRHSCTFDEFHSKR